MSTLKKYLQLYFAFFKASFIADLEFRVNFATRIVTDIFWYIAQISTFEILYQHTKIIGTWTLPQTRVFLGVLFVIDAFYMIIFHDNLERFTDRVRKGDLDLLLAKPVNSQFMISFQRIATALIGNLIIGSSWLIYSLSQLPNFSWLRVLWLLIFIPCGVTVVYCLRFAISATAVIFTRSENLQFLWYQVYKLGMRPDTLYFPWLKFIILTLLPVGIVASVPAHALLDPPNFMLFGWTIILCVLLIWLSGKFWRYCLSHYSSASS